jgi:hypothetical protein
MDLIGWLAAIVGGIIVNLIASELFAWGPKLSERLMQRAVRNLPPEVQDRMREEWASHLAEIPAGLWRILAASGFLLAANKINLALRINNEFRNQKTQEERDRIHEEEIEIDQKIDQLRLKLKYLEKVNQLLTKELEDQASLRALR